MRFRVHVILIVLVVVFSLYGIGNAGETDVQLAVNGSDIDGRIVTHISPNQIPLALGAGLLYSNDEDYWITHLRAGIQDEVFVSGLDLGLGFKGVFGEADIADEDLRIMGLAFQFLAGYDFRASSRVPVSVTADIAYAPEILSGGDTDSYLEFYTAGNFHINEWAALYVGYRVLDIDFDKNNFDLDDDAIFFGARLTF